MTEIARIFQNYPRVKKVFQTSDGWVILKQEDAEAQARHLPDQTITEIRRSDVLPHIPAPAGADQ